MLSQIQGKNTENSGFADGIILYDNNSAFYIMFHITFDYNKQKYNKFQIMTKPNSDTDVIFMKKDFTDKIWNKIMETTSG